MTPDRRRSVVVVTLGIALMLIVAQVLIIAPEALQ